jgi:hypothetical protein
MNSIWKFLSNPFEKSTRDSYQNAVKISVFHDNALAGMQTDPFYEPLYTFYHPIHVSLKDAYDNWATQQGAQAGQTVNLTQMFAELGGTKIDSWDIAVQNVFNKHTPEYKAILPHRRVPFQSGKQLERISAVKTLSNALTGIKALATVKKDVDDFYTALEVANNTQKTSKTSTVSQSQTMETARLAMCNAQYANLGAMIQKYSTQPEQINACFDLQTIRRSKKVSFSGKVKPGAAHTVAKHTFAAGEQVKLRNTGTTDLQFYLSPSKDVLPKTDGITLKAGEQNTADRTQLGDTANAWLMAFNPNTADKGAFEADLV